MLKERLTLKRILIIILKPLFMTEFKFNETYFDVYSKIAKSIKESTEPTQLLSSLSSISLGSKLLDPIDAHVTVKQVGIKGRVDCEPDNTNKYPYKWNHAVDGFGAVNLKTSGNLHTGYTDWSGRFHNV
jgi:hypothetical protein